MFNEKNLNILEKENKDTEKPAERKLEEERQRLKNKEIKEKIRERKYYKKSSISYIRSSISRKSSQKHYAKEFETKSLYGMSS